MIVELDFIFFLPEFEEIHFSVVFTAWIFGLEVILCYFLPHHGFILHVYFHLWVLGGFLVVVFFKNTFAKLII